jgi:hypothetical protein
MKKRMILGTFVAIMVLTMISMVVLAGDKGNDLPKGSHLYQLLLIATGDKMADIDSGKRIFIKMSGHTKILLTEGDFQVLDGNGTDGEAAFQLPRPEDDNPDDPRDSTGTPKYLVYVRVVGKPGPGIKITPVEYTDKNDQSTWIRSEEYLELSKSSKFTNETRRLLYLWVDTDDDGKADERVVLFDDKNKGYLWDVDNQGRKVVQMRFYPNVDNQNVGNP